MFSFVHHCCSIQFADNDYIVSNNQINEMIGLSTVGVVVAAAAAAAVVVVVAVAGELQRRQRQQPVALELAKRIQRRARSRGGAD